MAARVDAARNLVGHLPGSEADAGTLLLGSHLDTVRDAGAFDGPLGVLCAIDCVARLRAEEVTLPFALDVLGFSDEEGVRFGSAYLGSRALAGTLDDALLDRADDDGVTVRAALGGTAAPASRAGRAAARLLRGPHRAGTGARGARAAGRRRRRDRGRDPRRGPLPRARRPRRDGPDGAAPRCGGRAGGAGARGRGGRPLAPTASWRRSAGWRCGRARRTSSRARRSGRSTCGTPTTPCGRTPSPRSARARRRSRRPAASSSTWRDLLENAAVAMDPALSERLAAAVRAAGVEPLRLRERRRPRRRRARGDGPGGDAVRPLRGRRLAPSGRGGRRRRRRRRARRPRRVRARAGVSADLVLRGCSPGDIAIADGPDRGGRAGPARRPRGARRAAGSSRCPASSTRTCT